MSKSSQYSREAEESLIGAMILSNESVGLVFEELTVDDFYNPPCRMVARCINDLRKSNTIVDMVTVTNRLTALGLLAQIGSESFLWNIASNVVGAANVPHHIRIVKDKALLRRVVRIATDTLTAASEPLDDIPAFIDDFQRRVMGENFQRFSRVTRMIDDVTSSAVEEAVARISATDMAPGASTGFADLDRLLGRLRPGNLVIIAGRPGMGKTAFTTSIAVHAAINLGLPVVFFSLEMSAEDIGSRIVSSASGVRLTSVRDSMLTNEDIAALRSTVERFRNVPFFVDDSGLLSLMDMRSRVRRIAHENNGVGLVVVDYLQLMSARKRESREREISEISRGLKAFAKELRVPVIALSQLSRNVEHRESTHGRPRLSDLRESGAIEQDADIVIFLYRGSAYNNEVFEESSRLGRDQTEVIVAKHRNGRVGMVPMVFHAATVTFTENEGERS